jgi:hypothetical protein
MYILKCYCFKDSTTPNAVFFYKTKKAAENRKQKAIDSNCYYKIIMEVLKNEKAILPN